MDRLEEIDEATASGSAFGSGDQARGETNLTEEEAEYFPLLSPGDMQQGVQSFRVYLPVVVSSQ